MKRTLICIVLLLAVFPLACRAAGEDLMAKASEHFQTDKLEQEVEQYIGDVEFTEGIHFEEELRSLLEEGKRQFPSALRSAAASAGVILAIVLFCSLSEVTLEGTGNEEVTSVTLIGALAVTAVAVSDIHSLIAIGTQAVGKMETLSKILLPVMTVTAAAAGTPSAAAARQLATMLFSDVLLTLINRLLLPLVYAYIAACAVNTAIGNNGIKRLAELIKWLITSLLTVLLLVFIGYLTVSGVIAGSSDAMAIKAAKFAVSGMVPVVGGILSDAAETVLVGAGILKNSVGIAGLLAVLAICIGPFLQLGVHYLTYKFAATLAATVSESRVSGLVAQIGGAFGLVLGMTGACAILLLISIISAISVVVN